MDDTSDRFFVLAGGPGSADRGARAHWLCLSVEAGRAIIKAQLAIVAVRFRGRIRLPLPS